MCYSIRYIRLKPVILEKVIKQQSYDYVSKCLVESALQIYPSRLGLCVPKPQTVSVGAHQLLNQ